MNEQNIHAIARLVKTRRIEKNLTQQQLADLAGLSLRSVQRLEKGEGVSRMYTLETIATHLQLKDSFQQVLSSPGEATPSTNEMAAAKQLSKPQKIVLSISTAVFILLLIMAYVFQSPRFPETAFEMVLLIAVAVIVYSIVLFLVWR